MAPSGLQSTAYTSSACPGRSSFSFLLRTSHTCVMVTHRGWLAEFCAHSVHVATVCTGDMMGSVAHKINVVGTQCTHRVCDPCMSCGATSAP